LHFDCVEKAQASYFREHWNRLGLDTYEDHRLQLCMMNQVYAEVSSDNGYYIPVAKTAEIFGLTKSTFFRRVKSGAKIGQGLTLTPRGRPKIFKDEWKKPLWEYVQTCEALLLPPEPIELLLWINDTFHVYLSPDWIYQYLKEENGEYSLFGVTGKAMERSRAEITAKALQEWEQNELKTKLHKIHPLLLANFDESSDQPRLPKETKLVVSTKNCPTIFAIERGAKHVTCCPTIFLNGDHIKPFVIISAQSIHSELKEYGFPQTKDKKEQGCDGNHAYVVGSKSEYIIPTSS